MAFIPIGMNYHADVKGAVYKQVSCEKCQTEYFYRMERDALAGATSLLFIDMKGAEAAAVRKSQKKLQRLLATESDPVPCPNCGWFQDHMLEYARRQYMPWMRGLGRLLLFVAAILFVLWLAASNLERDSWGTWSKVWGILALSFLAAGAGLILCRIDWASRFNPNEFDQQKRINYGRRKTLSAEELEQLRSEPAPGTGES